MKRMLLVEDTQLYKAIVLHSFKKDYDIDAAGNLEEALELIDKNTYSVIIVDGQFPQDRDEPFSSSGVYGFRGNEVIARAKARGQPAYIVGYSMQPKLFKGCDLKFDKNQLDLTGLVEIVNANAK